MKWDRFPPCIAQLELYGGRFDAFRLAAAGCDVLFERLWLVQKSQESGRPRRAAGG